MICLRWVASPATSLSCVEEMLKDMLKECQALCNLWRHSHAPWTAYPGETSGRGQVPDRSGHFRTNSKRQIAVGTTGPNCKWQIAVGTTGPQQQAPDRRAVPDLNRKRQIACSGRCWTSTASFRLEWALPDLNTTKQHTHKHSRHNTLPAKHNPLTIS